MLGLLIKLILNLKMYLEDFPDSPVVGTPHFHCRGVQVLSLVGEPGSCMLPGVANSK